MRIGITGATGFLASYLIPRLRERGHVCVAFSRNGGQPVEGCVETRALSLPRAPDVSRLDAIVNLAGESIQGRWTEKKKQRIRESRIELTNSIIAALPGTDVRTLVSGSASGYYGDRGDETVTERSSQGRGFLAEIAADWEEAASAATSLGVRLALLRIGFVIAPRGGALAKIRPIFRLGLGGRLGSGRQWMPWVHVDDVCGLIVRLLEEDDLSGAFNAVSPHPVINAEFTRALASACRRPAFLHVPAFALRLALGELSKLAVDSTRALPERTLASGYAFRHSQLAEALMACVDPTGRIRKP